jgi:hypothetical protein
VRGCGRYGAGALGIAQLFHGGILASYPRAPCAKNPYQIESERKKQLK